MGDKILLWNRNAPGNTGEKKLPKLKLTRPRTKILALLNAAGYMGKEAFVPRPDKMDTLSYAWEIQPRRQSKRFEDEPYIMPYLVSGAQCGVLVVPGGGFAYRSDEAEGNYIAKKLNKKGVSAFVLYYRVNPYTMPVPLWDVRRALRVIRHRAPEWGIHPKKIGAIGFSAGGYLVESLSTILRKAHSIPDDDYQPDEIDALNGMPDFIALMYPVVSFQHLPCMMYGCFEDDLVANEANRQKLVEEYELKQYISADMPPHFICYGEKDTLVKPAAVQEYMAVLEQQGVPYKEVVLPANHGFANSKKYGVWFDEYYAWLAQCMQ